MPSLSSIFPGWAARRARHDAERARSEAEATAWRSFTNSYKGGVPTRTSEPWVNTPEERRRVGGGAMEQYQIGSARERGQHAYKNNPIARTLVNTETDNVIGDGLNYQPASSSEAWNREAKDRYYEWLDVASVRGGDVHTGCKIQRMAWEQSRIAGDCGWILVKRDTPTRINSKIQIVTGSDISTPDEFANDPNVYDGIRYDSWGRPVTYYVRQYEGRVGGGKREWAAIPADDFRFLYHPTTPNDARGTTAFITIFDLLAHLDRYVDGVSLAAWMATVFGVIFKQENAAKQLVGLPTLPDSQGVDRRAITMENGMVKFTGTKDEVVQVQAHQPMQQTPEFIRTMFRMLGQPFDMPLEVVAKDMSTCTFASARIGLLPFYRACRYKAAHFASPWGRTIFWWLSRERHRLPDDPKRWKTAFPEDYGKHELLVNAWDYTDPVSEVQSDMLQCDAGYKSHQMVLNERGRDGEQILRERHEWQAKTEGLPQLHSTLSRDAEPEPVEEPKPVGGRMAEPAENGNGKTRTQE